jgi:transcriptional regulator with XRE-family HTH domain
MILKRLREGRSWSQEQLAQFSGLSVRTIQRIERGHRASVESLKSLAATLEVGISTLQQEITVIDKTTEKWQSLPWWIRVNFWGSNMALLGFSRRKLLVRAEVIAAVSGVLLAFAGVFIVPALAGGAAMLVIAYYLAVLTRVADKYEIW